MVKAIYGGVTLGVLSVARQGFVDNIDNANLKTIADISNLTAIEIAHLDADISSLSGFVAFADYDLHDDSLAGGATYTFPANMFFGWISQVVGATKVNLEINRWGINWDSIENTDDLAVKLKYQNSSQYFRLKNDNGSALDISVFGVIWS